MNTAETRCNTCRFWKRIDKDDLTDSENCFCDNKGEDDSSFVLLGECRRHPPQLDSGLKLPGDGVQGRTSDAYWSSRFPVTFDDDWCGEHQPAPTPSAPPAPPPA